MSETSEKSVKNLHINIQPLIEEFNLDQYQEQVQSQFHELVFENFPRTKQFSWKTEKMKSDRPKFQSFSTAVNQHTFYDQVIGELRKSEVGILTYSFDNKQVQHIARKIKKLCKRHNDKKYCYFLTNYLKRSWKNLLKKGVPISEIEEVLKETIEGLKLIFPAASPLHVSEDLMKKHQSFAIKPSKQLLIDISKCLSNQKLKGLLTGIKNQAVKAEKHLQEFDNLLHPICRIYNGYHFKHGLKIRDKDHSKGIFRTLEKIMKGSFKKIDLKKYSQQYPDSTPEDFYKREQIHRDRQIQRVVKTHDNVYDWKIKDLLRGKCFFKDIQSLLKCKEHLFKIFSQKSFEVIELKNRLQSPTSDLVINFLIEDTICQIQLAMDFPLIDNQINHLLYELGRSDFMSASSTLNNLNKELFESFSESKKENVFELKEDDIFIDNFDSEIEKLGEQTLKRSISKHPDCLSNARQNN